MAIQDPQREREDLTQPVRERVDIFPPSPDHSPSRETERGKEREADLRPVDAVSPERAPDISESPSGAGRGAPPTPVAPPPQSEEMAEIERILSDGLEDIYLELPPAAQAQFRLKGEETAAKVLTLLQQAKVQVDKVLAAIRDWLKIIPGVNKFFLEQEAKIKTDRLLAIRNGRQR